LSSVNTREYIRYVFCFGSNRHSCFCHYFLLFDLAIDDFGVTAIFAIACADFLVCVFRPIRLTAGDLTIAGVFAVFAGDGIFSLVDDVVILRGATDFRVAILCCVAAGDFDFIGDFEATRFADDDPVALRGITTFRATVC